MTDRRVRLLLVDDHKVVRMGLATLFKVLPAFDLVGEAGSAAEAIKEARRSQPDVVLMDVRLPDADGISACRDILAEFPATRVIMLTSFSDEDAVVAAIMAGASGYVLKETEPDQLIQAVQTVADGGSLLDPAVTQTVLQFMRKAGSDQAGDPLSGLSDQERNILPLLADGKTNREIAAALFLSEHTIKTYVGHIFQKLHMARRAEAAAFVTRHQRPRDA